MSHKEWSHLTTGARVRARAAIVLNEPGCGGWDPAGRSRPERSAELSPSRDRVIPGLGQAARPTSPGTGSNGMSRGHQSATTYVTPKQSSWPTDPPLVAYTGRRPSQTDLFSAYNHVVSVYRVLCRTRNRDLPLKPAIHLRRRFKDASSGQPADPNGQESHLRRRRLDPD